MTTENPEAPKPQDAAAVACTDLLAAVREYERKHPSQMHIPHLRLFCDGSGALILRDIEMFEFYNLDELMEKLEAANVPAQRPPTTDV